VLHISPPVERILDVRRESHAVKTYLNYIDDLREDAKRYRFEREYIDRQLGIATFMTVIKLACDTIGARLHWNGHYPDRFGIQGSGDRNAVYPDAHFALEVPNLGTAHHFLELDRGNVSLQRMEERYRHYFTFWQFNAGDSFPHFRVITVCEVVVTSKRCERQRAELEGPDLGELCFLHLAIHFA
jgi:hypothetical protein